MFVAGRIRNLMPAIMMSMRRGAAWNMAVRLCFAVILCWLGGAYPSDVRAAEGESAGRALVLDESLPVHSGMSASSSIVKSLTRGDVVTIEYEMEGSEGAWCGIMEEGSAAISGYVLCRHLKRDGHRRKSWERVGPGVGTGDDTTNVIVSGGQVLVPATLGYKGTTVEALLLLDTGASISLINTDTADRLGIRPDETKMGLGQVVGGGLILLFMTKVDYLTAGPYTKRGMEIDVVLHKGLPVKFDGLLGMDFLRDLKYTVDTRNHVIRWEGSQ